MSVCYCLQFSINFEGSCDLTYTDCEGNLVTETFSGGGQTYNICSQDLVPTSPCPDIEFYVNGLCENNECTGTPIKQRNECDPITIFPMGVQCLVSNPTYTTTYDGSAALIITGGTPPYTIIWDIGSVSSAINNLGPGEYGATVIDYYGDFTANTICVLTGETPTPSPTPTPTPTPIPLYGDLCFVIGRRIGGIVFDQTIQFNYNGIYNGQATWLSDDFVYNLVWMSGSTQWEISGWTFGSIVNINPASPPLIGWQSIGGLGTITSIEVYEGSCNNVGLLSYKISKNDPTCECNGSIIIDVEQGEPPYMYSINNGDVYQESPIFNSLCSGTYITKVVDNSGTTKVDTVTLNEPELYTEYTLQLNLNIGLGTFDITVTPALPLGTSISFDLIHTKNFEVSPTSSAATYTNNVILNVNASPVPITNTSQTNTAVPLFKTCSPGSLFTTQTTNVWENIVITNSTTINGTISDTVIPITPLAKCYSAVGSYGLSLDNVQINDCDCCNVSVINPAKPG